MLRTGSFTTILRPVVRRSVSILLVFFYLFSLFGGLAAFLAAQGQIRSEIKQRIKQSVPESELVLISVTAEDASSLRWIKSFEFRYRGGLYDVVRTERSGDTTHYHCINDVQEERLFAALDEYVRRQMAKDARTGRTGSSPGNAGSPDHLPSLPMPMPPAVVAGMVTLASSHPPPSPIQEVPVPPPRAV